MPCALPSCWCWWAVLSPLAGSSGMRGESCDGQGVGRGPEDPAQWGGTCSRGSRSCWDVATRCSAPLIAAAIFWPPSCSVPTFLCNRMAENMFAAWLRATAVTDQSTYNKTVYAHLVGALQASDRLLLTSTRVGPSSEAGSHFCAYFAPNWSEEIAVVAVRSLPGHVGSPFWEGLTDYPPWRIGKAVALKIANKSFIITSIWRELFLIIISLF